MISISYNGVYLGDYGLVVSSKDADRMTHIAESVQMTERSYSAPSVREPREISMEIAVIGDSDANLLAKMDAIKRVLGQYDDRKLSFDSIPGRYWNARFVSIEGVTGVDREFEGIITFRCADPIAYSDTLSSVSFPVTATPTTVFAAVGGSAFIRPVYTLTSSVALSLRTITFANNTTGQAITWTGALGANTPLVIDSALWLVQVGGTPSMATVAGQFPQMAPGTANQLRVTNFGTSGTLAVSFREAYL